MRMNLDIHSLHNTEDLCAEEDVDEAALVDEELDELITQFKMIIKNTMQYWLIEMHDRMMESINKDPTLNETKVCQISSLRYGKQVGVLQNHRSSKNYRSSKENIRRESILKRLRSNDRSGIKLCIVWELQLMMRLPLNYPETKIRI